MSTKSNLIFETHEPPLLEYESRFGKDFRVMTITWKGLPFLRVTYSDDTALLKRHTARIDEDEEDDDDDEGKEVDKELSAGYEALKARLREYNVQCLMEDFKYYWGKAESLDEAVKLALVAEKALVAFVYKIQTRKTP